MSTTRRVLVTGGNRGIGEAIARHLTEQGHEVVVTSRSGDAPEGLRAVACDVTDTASVDQALKDAEEVLGGTVEVLVANAGITKDNLFVALKDEDWEQVLAVNLTSTFRLARAAVKVMMRRRFGRIIGIARPTRIPVRRHFCDKSLKNWYLLTNSCAR